MARKLKTFVTTVGVSSTWRSPRRPADSGAEGLRRRHQSLSSGFRGRDRRSQDHCRRDRQTRRGSAPSSGHRRAVPRECATASGLLGYPRRQAKARDEAEGQATHQPQGGRQSARCSRPSPLTKRAKRERVRAQGRGHRRAWREKRRRAVEAAEAALAEARRDHEDRNERLERERSIIEQRLQAEQDDWEAQRRKLESVVDRARKSDCRCRHGATMAAPKLVAKVQPDPVLPLRATSPVAE